MQKGWWTKSVTVRLGRRNIAYTVNNTVLAARLLLDEWPEGGGEAYLAARLACLAALEGGSDEDARVAFEAAAVEVGVLG